MTARSQLCFCFLIKLSHVSNSSPDWQEKFRTDLVTAGLQKLENGMKLISQFYWHKTWGWFRCQQVVTRQAAGSHQNKIHNFSLLMIVMIVIVITNIVIVLTCQPPGPVWWRGCWKTLLWGDMRWADWEIFLVCDHPGLAWSGLPCLWCNCIENSWRAPQYKHLVISHANFTPRNWKSQHHLGLIVKLCRI